MPEGPPEQIALLIYPKFTALDLIGPHTFLAALGNVKVHLVWKSLEPVTSDNGLRIHPNATFNDCPQHLRSCSSLTVSKARADHGARTFSLPPAGSPARALYSARGLLELPDKTLANLKKVLVTHQFTAISESFVR